jgi:hypothetical protein
VTPDVVVEIGGTAVRLSTEDPALVEILQGRYAGFITDHPTTVALQLKLHSVSDLVSGADDVRVTRSDGLWRFERSDFVAEWSPDTGQGTVRQALPNPYSIDTVLRILHSVVLAPQRGFLLHAASAIRNGRAFVFSGLSGAGKTTISRLAPPDVTLLSDEISYIRLSGDRYRAFGTPFAGELAQSGENVSAPLEAVFLLAQGPENRRDPVAPAEAARALLRNILFFAADPGLVELVFRSALDCVSRVPVWRLTFVPDPGVWEMIA